MNRFRSFKIVNENKRLRKTWGGAGGRRKGEGCRGDMYFVNRNVKRFGVWMQEAGRKSKNAKQFSVRIILGSGKNENREREQTESEEACSATRFCES